MIYIPIFVNAALLLLFDYRCLSFSLLSGQEQFGVWYQWAIAFFI